MYFFFKIVSLATNFYIACLALKVKIHLKEIFILFKKYFSPLTLLVD